MIEPIAYAASPQLAPGGPFYLRNTSARNSQPLATTVIAIRDNAELSSERGDIVATALLVCAGEPGDDVYLTVDVAYRRPGRPLAGHVVLREQWASTIEEALHDYRA